MAACDRGASGHGRGMGALRLAQGAMIKLPQAAQFAIELAIFGAAALALAAADQPELAIALTVVALVSGSLNYVEPR
jgi:Protein of unknown function (DUF2568)